MAWLRGSRGSRGTPPADDDSLLATAEWFGDGTAFTSDRQLIAALLQMAGTHAPDGTPRGLLIRGAGGNTAVPTSPASVEEAFQWLDEVLGSDDRAELRRSQLRARMRNVIEHGVIPVFQPIVDLSAGSVAGVEAFSRFGRGSPERWFKEAADVGMREVLETAAIRAAVGILREIPEDVYLSLNVSPMTLLRPETGRLLQAAPLSRLVIEMTEAAMTLDRTTVSQVLQPLRQAGARLAVDDAGTGNTSLRQLLLLHPDIIKIDTSVTCGIQHGRARRALAGALVSFAREIGSTVVAEGIESEAELEAVRECGVTHGQGFHLAFPTAPPLDLSAVSAGRAPLGARRLSGMRLHIDAA
jgi:EAL domain-containing protein (putative c-di-GMP-specific phosphodiesterase class I)